MYKAETKSDLIIEVWEKLDCENVGRNELVAIENAVRDRFGKQAVESPMKIARLLADEGAELRHAEIMELYIERRSDMPYAPEFRNLINTNDLRATHHSLRMIENLRRKYSSNSDKDGIRLLRQQVISAKENAKKIATDSRTNKETAEEKTEIAEWLTIWLQSPELFENWVALRLASNDFIAKFGSVPGRI